MSQSWPTRAAASEERLLLMAVRSLAKILSSSTSPGEDEPHAISKKLLAAASALVSLLMEAVGSISAVVRHTFLDAASLLYEHPLARLTLEDQQLPWMAELERMRSTVALQDDEMLEGDEELCLTTTHSGQAAEGKEAHFFFGPRPFRHECE